jgi:hypothetical protein
MTDHLRHPTADSPDARACARVDERLLDYLEGDLPAGDRAELEAHLAGCARCHALVADLRAISADAAALPVLRPERDLWAGIAHRIEAPVVPLAARTAPDEPTLQVTHTTRRAAPAGRATVAVSRRWLAAAAAALIAATSGATWLATRGGTAVDPRVAVTPADRPAAPVAVTPAPATVATVEPAPDTTVAPAAAPLPAPRRTTARLVRRPVNPIDAAVPGAVEYDRAIRAMRTAVGERRSELDSSTVAVLERNLRIIDEAIRQSREALARDPNSPFLGRALTTALDRKLELLRTAAMLPRS